MLPVRNIDRNPTLPRHGFRIDASGIASHIPSTATSVQLTLGAGYGITNYVEVGFSLPALQLTPTVEGIDPAVYVTAGVSPSDWLTLVPLLRLTAPIRPSDLWTIDMNLSLQITLTNSVQIVIPPTFSISITDPVQSSLSVPFSVLAQLTRRLFVQPQIGFSLGRTNPRFMAARPGDPLAFDQLMFVVSGTLGYTVGRADETMADISVTWLWPGLVQEQPSGTSTQPGDWSLTLGVSLYLPQLARERSERPRPSPRAAPQ